MQATDKSRVKQEHKPHAQHKGADSQHQPTRASGPQPIAVELLRHIGGGYRAPRNTW